MMQYPLTPCKEKKEKETVFSPGKWYMCVRWVGESFTKDKIYLCVGVKTNLFLVDNQGGLNSGPPNKSGAFVEYEE